MDREGMVLLNPAYGLVGGWNGVRKGVVGPFSMSE